MTAAQFVGLLFLGRDVAHSVHLNTRSFSKHMALNTFYDEIVGLADSFAEAYQGRHGLIGQIAVPANKKAANIIEFLQSRWCALRCCAACSRPFWPTPTGPAP